MEFDRVNRKQWCRDYPSREITIACSQFHCLVTKRILHKTGSEMTESHSRLFSPLQSIMNISHTQREKSKVLGSRKRRKEEKEVPGL